MKTVNFIRCLIATTADAAYKFLSILFGLTNSFLALSSNFLISFSVVPSKGTKQIIKFAGETVTLPSGVNKVLRQVFWSIFSNTTYIASYEGGRLTIDWLPQYSGRLDLNTSTGK